MVESHNFHVHTEGEPGDETCMDIIVIPHAIEFLTVLLDRVIVDTIASSKYKSELMNAAY